MRKAADVLQKGGSVLETKTGHKWILFGQLLLQKRQHRSVGKSSACNAGDLGSIPGREDPLEKEMATHSNILAWEIPWTEEPGGLQSTGLQRVGYD